MKLGWNVRDRLYRGNKSSGYVSALGLGDSIRRVVIWRNFNSSIKGAALGQNFNNRRAALRPNLVLILGEAALGSILITIIQYLI
jgi:hypothetical protein